MVECFFVDEKRAAEIIHQPVRTLRQWLYTGYGPTYHKQGAWVRYLEEDLIAWLWGKRVVPGSDRAEAPA
jgi:hypothetical protein